MQNTSVRADRIYMRKDDEPVFTWQREGDEKRVSSNTLELGLMDKPQTISLTLQDAAMLDIHITGPDGKKLANLKLTGSAKCEDWGTLALDDWSQLNFPDHSKGKARFPACQGMTFTITADGCEPVTQALGTIKPGEKKEVRVVMKSAAKPEQAK